MEIIIDDEANFRIDWGSDPELSDLEGTKCIVQQLYALIMGWA